METAPLSVCFDKYLPGQSYRPDKIVTRTDFRNTDNRELALEKYKAWQSGQTLRISFMDGSPAVQDRVIKHAVKWLDHANLHFEFGNFPDPDIRISFRGRGYWSLVGTDALKASRYEPTMQLGGFTETTDETEVQKTVLHEFGHALGCIHEHSSPSVNIPWNVPEVYAFYWKYAGWDKSVVDHNVLKRYSKKEVSHTEHDPLSIMQYPVQNELTLGDFAIDWNTELSEGDKAFIRLMYP